MFGGSLEKFPKPWRVLGVVGIRHFGGGWFKHRPLLNWIELVHFYLLHNPGSGKNEYNK